MSIEIVGNACFRCDVMEFLIGAPKFQAALQIIETQHNSLHQNFGLFSDNRHDWLRIATRPNHDL